MPRGCEARWGAGWVYEEAGQGPRSIRLGSYGPRAARSIRIAPYDVNSRLRFREAGN